jgi:hypothetical protein
MAHKLLVRDGITFAQPLLRKCLTALRRSWRSVFAPAHWSSGAPTGRANTCVTRSAP